MNVPRLLLFERSNKPPTKETADRNKHTQRRISEVNLSRQLKRITGGGRDRYINQLKDYPKSAPSSTETSSTISGLMK
jgi:hypothetical protein